MKKIVVVIVIVLFLFCSLSILILYVRCQQFNSPPQVPIYPGSVRVKEISGGTDVFPIYEYHYNSTASPEEIGDFYIANKALCHRTSGLEVGQVCTGDAKPFGTYTVGINFEFDEVEPLTTYSINVLWTRCGNFD